MAAQSGMQIQSQTYREPYAMPQYLKSRVTNTGLRRLLNLLIFEKISHYSSDKARRSKSGIIAKSEDIIAAVKKIKGTKGKILNITNIATEMIKILSEKKSKFIWSAFKIAVEGATTTDNRVKNIQAIEETYLWSVKNITGLYKSLNPYSISMFVEADHLVPYDCIEKAWKDMLSSSYPSRTELSSAISKDVLPCVLIPYTAHSKLHTTGSSTLAIKVRKCIKMCLIGYIINPNSKVYGIKSASNIILKGKLSRPLQKGISDSEQLQIKQHSYSKIVETRFQSIRGENRWVEVSKFISGHVKLIFEAFKRSLIVKAEENIEISKSAIKKLNRTIAIKKQKLTAAKTATQVSYDSYMRKPTRVDSYALLLKSMQNEKSCLLDYHKHKVKLSKEKIFQKHNEDLFKLCCP